MQAEHSWPPDGRMCSQVEHVAATREKVGCLLPFRFPDKRLSPGSTSTFRCNYAFVHDVEHHTSLLGSATVGGDRSRK